MKEVERKLSRLREKMATAGIAAVRLRGVDWFAWATAGGDAAVAFNEEAGVAEIFLTEKDAWVLTNRIEAERLRTEELSGLTVAEFPWENPEPREAFVRERAGAVTADIPRAGETPLPADWALLRRTFEPEEVARYRELGKDAARALTATLTRAEPGMSEFDLAGLAAENCWRLGIQPILTMAAGEQRLRRYRHPVTKGAALGGRAMVVICGRRHGLFANLTRHVFWREPTEDERLAEAGVLAAEAAAFAATREGASLRGCYEELAAAYRGIGREGEIYLHHQGGPCGYRTREEVAMPGASADPLRDGWRAYAWNPSLPGAKVEDTILRGPDGKLEILTVDPAWPTREHAGLPRPANLVRPGGGASAVARALL